MGKKKPKMKSSLEVGEASDQPTDPPTRKRGRPKKVVEEEKGVDKVGTKEEVDEEDDGGLKKLKNEEKSGTTYEQQKVKEVSSSSANMEETNRREKHRSRAKRKSQPRKSS